MKFKIITLGCKVNTYESEFMEEELLKSSFIKDINNPDIIIVNTCSVTNMADSKSLKIIRREKREHPNSILVVCGCSIQNDYHKYADLDIAIMLGNEQKSQIVKLINNYLLTREPYQYINSNRHLPFEDMQVCKFTSHTRAFIKIQDGCNNFCSYCIIPYTRGDIRSKDFIKIIEEAKILVKNGHQEIVLTGIHTGSYSNNGHDLSDLLEELSKIDNLKRLRISSIEITELDTKFLHILKTNPKICNHLHIPLQSGSDIVLKRMNRKYDTAYYLNKINEIRSIRPDISITTDCIVGHPYETDEEFVKYLEFCKKVNFSKIHVFPYSIRVGTASATMPQINSNIKKERARKLIALNSELEYNYALKFIGQDLTIITEEIEGEYTVGHTSNYLKIYVLGLYSLNTEYLVSITSVTNNKIIGNIKIV